MSWEQIPGWSSEIIPFYEAMAPRIPGGGTFVEIGCFLGRSLACMGTLRPDVKLWALDPWVDGRSDGYEGPGIFQSEVDKHGGLFAAFIANMKEHAPDVLDRLHIIRARSDDLRSLPFCADMVFIDGAHDYANVGYDIGLALSALADRGIISGHDYHPDFAGLCRAVDERFPNRHIMGGPCACWWAELP